MLEEKLTQLHAEAPSLSFGWYLRTGAQHPRLKQIMHHTHSLQAFIVHSLKYSPDQPRVPAGNPDGGQWTSGGGGDGDDSDDDTSIIGQVLTILENIFGNVLAAAADGDEDGGGDAGIGTDSGGGDSAPDDPGVDFLAAQTPAVPSNVTAFLNSTQSDVLASQPVTGVDPGPKGLLYNDGTPVIDSFTGKPLLMPSGVSLQNNLDTGQQLHNLPSVFGDTTTSGSFFPEKEASMVSMFWRDQPMDYQRIYSDTGLINQNYIDFGNYNYGAVAAAAGYSSNEALLGAGVANAASAAMSTPSEIINAMAQSPDKYQTLSDQLSKLWTRLSGDYLNSPRGESLILQGYNDYVSGKYDR